MFTLKKNTLKLGKLEYFWLLTLLDGAMPCTVHIFRFLSAWSLQWQISRKVFGDPSCKTFYDIFTCIFEII